LAPDAAWCEAAHEPHELLNSNGLTQPLVALTGHRVAAFCGIGNPAAFRHALENAGANIVFWREFADHHAYFDADLAKLASGAAAANSELVVCTHKDLVKLSNAKIGCRELWALTIEMQFRAGQDALENALARAAKMVQLQRK
jgi:tetraacyldisaccharide 4'-kinase